MSSDLDTFLSTVCAHPHLEAAWLKTLSLLEHLGAKKIHRILGDNPTEEELEHAADEARHAYGLTRCAEGLANKADPLAREAACRYMSELDHGLSEWFPNDITSRYLVVTSAIERRAMVVYAAYRKATSRVTVREELTRIMEEENAHRVPMEREAKRYVDASGKTWVDLVAFEERIFVSFVDALVRCIRAIDRPSLRRGQSKEFPGHLSA